MHPHVALILTRIKVTVRQTMDQALSDKYSAFWTKISSRSSVIEILLRILRVQVRDSPVFGGCIGFSRSFQSGQIMNFTFRIVDMRQKALDVHFLGLYV